MLAKRNRLSKSDIDLLFKKGDSFRTPFIIIRSQKSDHPMARFAILFAKNLKLNSVERNLLRRQTYTMIRGKLGNLPTERDYGILLTQRFVTMKPDQRREALAKVIQALIPL